VIGPAFAAFAATGVAVKEAAENAIAAATAIMGIVFLFRSYERLSLGRACAPHPRIQLNKD
jgi:hypothetical protein